MEKPKELLSRFDFEAFLALAYNQKKNLGPEKPRERKKDSAASVIF